MRIGHLYPVVFADTGAGAVMQELRHSSRCSTLAPPPSSPLGGEYQASYCDAQSSCLKQSSRILTVQSLSRGEMET